MDSRGHELKVRKASQCQEQVLSLCLMVECMKNIAFRRYNYK